MSMNKVVVSAIVAAGLMVVGVNSALAADAANGNAAPMMAHEGMDADKASKHMQKQLGLTDDQTSKVKAIMQDMHEEGEKIRQEMVKLKESTDAKFKEVLTPEQYTKWQSMRESRMQRAK